MSEISAALSANSAPLAAAAPWPAYTVERKPIVWLKPSPTNARTHGKEQISQLRGSLEVEIKGHKRRDADTTQGDLFAGPSDKAVRQ
jgi:hypothetical protein